MVVLRSSSEPLVEALGAEMQTRQESSTKKGSQTVGARFRDQLRDLMQRLERCAQRWGQQRTVPTAPLQALRRPGGAAARRCSPQFSASSPPPACGSTSLHFIRCIKPNKQQAAGAFDADLVLHQLRCAGVLEVTRIARAGYPTRYRHDQFVERYRLLLPELARGGALPRNMDMLGACRRLLRHFKVDAEQYRIGRTRLFFRVGVLGQMEEACARMQRCVGVRCSRQASAGV